MLYIILQIYYVNDRKNIWNVNFLLNDDLSSCNNFIDVEHLMNVSLSWSQRSSSHIKDSAFVMHLHVN